SAEGDVILEVPRRDIERSVDIEDDAQDDDVPRPMPLGSTPTIRIGVYPDLVRAQVGGSTSTPVRCRGAIYGANYRAT
ncbi:MAG: hypothetical protein QOI10_4311, partial [Solirubrobacterales bacterium]|nr:hypothetical protein [Solirubrobacterales bacterium]